MVWGSMIALSTIAGLQADTLFKHRAKIEQVLQRGSVITQDAGTLVLAKIAVAEKSYSMKIFPFLLDLLQTCKASSLPQYAEKTLLAVTAKNKSSFLAVVKKRCGSLTPPQLKRIEKVIILANQR